MIAAIVAVDNNWGIGYNGDLLEHIPEDLKYFKQLTTNHVVVMGRKTWDSLPVKPLKDRLNLVVTTGERQYAEMTCFIGMAETMARLAHVDDDEEWFIIGGSSIYEQLLPLCDRVYVTKIYKNHENVDAYFPNLDESEEWAPAACQPIQDYKDLTYQFWQYDRIN
jgi:dihydrofolate reductase